MRSVKNILAVVLLLCSGALLLHTFLLDETVNFLLRHGGASDIEVHGVSLGLHSSTVDSCTASLVLSNDDHFEIAIYGASFQYDVRQLLQNGKGRLAEVDSMVLTLKKKKAAITGDVLLPNRIVILREELRTALPMERLRVGKVILMGDFQKPLLKKNIALDLRVNGGELDLTLSTQLSSEVFVDLRMTSPNPDHAEARIRIREAGGEVLQAQVALSPDVLSVTADFEIQELQSLLALEETDFVLPEVAGKIDLRLDYPLNTSSQKAFMTTLSATDLEYLGLRCSTAYLYLAAAVTDEGVDFGSDSRVELVQLRGRRVGIEELSLGLGGSVSRLQGGASVKFSSQQRIAVKGAKYAQVEFSDLELGFEDPLQVHMEEGRWGVTDNVLMASPLQLSQGEQILESGPLRCGFSGLTTGLSAPGLNIHTPRLVGTDGTQTLAFRNIRGDLQRVEDQLNGKWQFVPELFGGQVRARFSHGLLSGAGSFSLNTQEPLQFSKTGAALSSLLSPWSFPFDLDTGRLSLRAQGSYAPGTDPKLRLWTELSEASGYFQQFLFTGLGVKQELSLLPEMQVEGRGSITLEHLIGGLDSYHIRADVELGQSNAGILPTLMVDNFSATLLGGSVSSSSIVYDLNAPDSSFVVGVKTMGLGQLVGLVNMDDLMVTGAISGAIPVRIHGQEITVSGAELHSEGEGGEIHYTSGMINHVGITGYALKAVEDLQYEKLSVTADYAASGQLDLLIAIRGTSPGLSTTRPVHLNINAEQNLPALLKSLRFSKGLTEELDKRIKRHYN